VTAMQKGLLLGVLQLALVFSLAGKLLYDRMTRPRVWVLTQVFDPELPIRGRYLSERLQLATEGFTYIKPDKNQSMGWYVNRQWGYLEVRNNQLLAKQQGSGPGEWVHLQKNDDGTLVALAEEPVLVFIPDSAQVPILTAGQETWVEVTVPTKGPPRAIRIGIKKNGVLTPLDFK
jgi:hypothetical protein